MGVFSNTKNCDDRNEKKVIQECRVPVEQMVNNGVSTYILKVLQSIGKKIQGNGGGVFKERRFFVESRGFLRIYGGKERWGVKKVGFYRKMGFSWVFGQEFGEKQGRAGNLIISGKSGKLGKSKESKRPVLNVDKILDF